MCNTIINICTQDPSQWDEHLKKAKDIQKHLRLCRFRVLNHCHSSYRTNMWLILQPRFHDNDPKWGYFVCYSGHCLKSGHSSTGLLLGVHKSRTLGTLSTKNWIFLRIRPTFNYKHFPKNFKHSILQKIFWYINHNFYSLRKLELIFHFGLPGKISKSARAK